MARNGPADQDGAEAIRRLLSGLARGDDMFDLAAAIEELHPPHNTFPGEVFMRLSTDALEVAGVGLRPAVVSPVKDHLAGQASLDSMPRCRRSAIFPPRDWQQAGARGASR